MPKIIQAAATALPSRRTMLATLAGAGAALSLPKAVLAATSPDAALLALKPEVEMLHAVCEAMAERVAVAERLAFAKLPSPDLRASDVAQEAADEAWAALRDEITDTPAKTLAGIRFKAMVAEQNCCMDDDLMRSIVADLLALEGGAHG